MIGTTHNQLTFILVIVLTYHQVASFNWVEFEVVACTRMAFANGCHKKQKL